MAELRQQNGLANLRQTLVARFNEGELRTLCFDLRIDYDSLPGEGKADKARELIAYLERHNCVSEFLKAGHRHRPDIPWTDLYGFSPSDVPFRPFKLLSGDSRPIVWMIVLITGGLITLIAFLRLVPAARINVIPTRTDIPASTPVVTPIATSVSMQVLTPTMTVAAVASTTPTAAIASTYDKWTVALPSCNCVQFVTGFENIIVRLRWGATTSTLAEKGADFISYTVTIDGRPIPGIENYRRPATFVGSPAYREDPSNAWWVYWDYPAGELGSGLHRIEAAIVTTLGVDTGWSVIPAGTKKTFEVELWPFPTCPSPDSCK